ncbi:MAG TPA: vanadium-dependent haloperoxidase [Blastocatellia bacterium]|nr:vanadium-dependent haloperoxidase [Blastocatellia bacterium]
MSTKSNTHPSASPCETSTDQTRRQFLHILGSATAGTAALAASEATPAQGRNATRRNASVREAVTTRVENAYRLRVDAANFQRNRPAAPSVANDDEREFPNKIGCYSKALPHNGLGEVNLSAWDAFKNALNTGQSTAFDAIPMGGPVKLANPQAAYTFDLEGADSHQLFLATAPRFSSSETASEMAEVYWQAVTRDIHFSAYETNELINQAAVDLSRFTDFKGPRAGGLVAPSTLFRGLTPGDLTGPYVSQFLLKDIPYGAHTIKQQYRVPVAGDDFMTGYSEWLNIQNGGAPTRNITFDPMLRYIRNGRDLGEWDHRDFTYQGFLNAALILLGYGRNALDSNNPYYSSATQGGFSTFGGPHILDLVARVANAGLRAAWCQKWLVHLRLRPEAFSGCVHNLLTNAATAPIHRELLNSSVLDVVARRFGTYLLPMAYPEGCPTHPAYPSGHAVIAGACVTALKAFFNEDFVIPNPVVASADGLSLEAYTGATLTVGGELNKLATNVGIGRDTAGVHWRTDCIEGLKLGEAVTLSCMQDFRGTFNESFRGFRLTKFDGTTVEL